MRRLLYSVILSTAILVSCNKSYDPTVTFERVGFYFKWGAEPTMSYFTTSHVSKMELTSVSDGWDCVLDFANYCITITPPEDPGTEEEREELKKGTASFKVTSSSGNTESYTLKFYILDDKNHIDLSDNGTKCANCYVATEPKTLYTICIAKDGMGNILPRDVASVEVVWQSRATLIQDLSLEDELSATFFVDRDIDDNGEDIKDDDGNLVIRQGNAVIAALDSDGYIIWSWHIWLVHKKDNPLKNVAKYANGKTFMEFNLGAFNNSNGSEGDEDILDSYGLYYQWGRKDPFLRPMYYRCEYGSDEYVYNASGSVEYVDIEETNESIDEEYARQNPMTFFKNEGCMSTDPTVKSGDWKYTSSNTLWSDTKKTENDPCPYGWRVPAKNDFDILCLTAEEDAKDLDEARKQFGWHLSDGNKTYFYLAAGFHSYYDGVLRNMNQTAFPGTPEPWEGYYWTSGTSGDQSECMFFDLTTTRAFNKFNLHNSSKRANAYQVRCVKID